MPFLYSHRLINPLRLESAHRNASQDHQVLWARTNLIDMEIEAIN